MNKETIVRKTSDFWNNKKVIKTFASQPESKYWLPFFNSQQSRSKKKVLDLGCGTGRNTKMLLGLNYDVYVCDLYKGMLESAKREYLKYSPLKYSKKKVSLCSMDNLSYKSNFFDAILCHGVYHNATSVSEFKKALKESVRVLKNGGYLCFNVFSSGFIEKGLKKVRDDLYLTKEELLMVLISKKIFLKETQKFGLVIHSPIVEYISNVSTGKRSVMRGILKKVI
jgi:ubiquinone/menaquinone biosynthesis C-methylase UbiE